MKRFLFLFLFVATQSFSQSSVNEYKYVDVPNKFDFLKAEDKYQLNSLTKFLFTREGFNILPEQENHPDDYKEDWCTALKANVISTSKMFGTRLSIELVDCKGNVVFTSTEGKSRNKDYKTGYHEALRNTFKSIAALNYKYIPKPKEKIVSVSKPIVNEQSISDEAKIILPTEEKIIEQKVDVVVNDNTLYAQQTANGYQLVDTSPKVVFILKKTSVKDMYVIIGKDGTVIYKDGKWIAEYYEGEVLKREILSIKF